MRLSHSLWMHFISLAKNRVSGLAELYPMYRVVIPIGSRAASKREGVTEVSSRTKENMPSSMLHKSLPCSLYWDVSSVQLW